MKNRILLLLGLLLPLLAYPQTAYRTTQGPDGKQIVRKESVPGSKVYDVVVSSLPSDAVRARIAGRVLIPYAPEPAQQFNPSQFGLNKYYSPNYKFSIDFAAGHTRAQRKAYGVNMFNDFAVPEDQRSQYLAGEGMAYNNDNNIHGSLEGVHIYEVDLQTYYNNICSRLPYYGSGDLVFMKYVFFNIETSNEWSRNSYTGANSFFPSWDSSKNKSIKCESDGVVRTLEQLNNMGAAFWANEHKIRRANRFTLLLKATKELCPTVKVGIGGSMYQGLPRVDFRNGNGTIYDGICNVANIGGDSEGNITLSNARGGSKTYKLAGTIWAAEDINLGYYYLFNFDISGSDYNDIVVQKKAGTQNYPYLWSKIKTRHIVADEKGFIQLNRAEMLRTYGFYKPMWRMVEPMYEEGGVVDRSYPATFIHAPFTQLQNTIPFGNGTFDTPKVWQEPYLMYSRYMVNRFHAGNTPDAGFYLFPTNPNISKGDPASYPAYQHELHTMTALFQGRADLQPYEQYFARSSLIEDPEVLVNQTGGWSAYDGTEAYNYNGGVQGVQKPAYMLRYEATSTGWRVLILGGMNQDWTAERTDLVRAPGGLLNGNTFRVKLRGPSAQVYEFAVSSSDKNQIYEATPVAQTSWEKPGYGGRVGAAVTTPPSSTTTTPAQPPATDNFNYPTVSGNQLAWNSSNSKVLGLDHPQAVGQTYVVETSQVKLEVRARYGGAIQIYDKADNNRPQINFRDHGREAELTLYSGPVDYSRPIGGTWEYIGKNPISPGDEGENGSPIQASGLVTGNDGNQWIYIKIQMPNWPSGEGNKKDGSPNSTDLLPVWSERWIRLDGNKVHVKFRSTWNVEDNVEQGALAAKIQQEYPTVMLSGNTQPVSFVVGAGSFGTAPVVESNLIEPGRLDPSHPAERQVPLGFDQTTFHLTEPWQAKRWPSGRYFGVYTPTYYRVTNEAASIWNGVTGRDGSDDEGSNPVTYITNLMNQNMNNKDVHYGSYTYMVTGSVNEVRQYALSQPRNAVPNYTFNMASGRNDWHVENGITNSHPYTSDGLTALIGGYNQDAGGNVGTFGSINTPGVAWQASGVPVIYIRMAYTGSQSSLKLSWCRNGQAEQGVDSNRPQQINDRYPNGARNQQTQVISIPVVGDGVMRTIPISLSGHPEWYGVITQMYINGFARPPGEQVKLLYFGVNNPGN